MKIVRLLGGCVAAGCFGLALCGQALAVLVAFGREPGSVAARWTSGEVVLAGLGLFASLFLWAGVALALPGAGEEPPEEESQRAGKVARALVALVGLFGLETAVSFASGLGLAIVRHDAAVPPIIVTRLAAGGPLWFTSSLASLTTYLLSAVALRSATGGPVSASVRARPQARAWFVPGAIVGRRERYVDTALRDGELLIRPSPLLGVEARVLRLTADGSRPVAITYRGALWTFVMARRDAPDEEASFAPIAPRRWATRLRAAGFLRWGNASVDALPVLQARALARAIGGAQGWGASVVMFIVFLAIAVAMVFQLAATL